MEPLGARLPTSPVGLWRRWRQRRVIRRLRNDGSLAAVRILARALAWDPPEDGVALHSLLGALAAMGEPAQLRVMAEEATAGGAHHAPTPLLRLLKSPDRFPLLPADHRVAVAMACGEPELLAQVGDEVVPPLLKAWERQGPKGQAETALLALRSPAALNALCRHWIDEGAREDHLRQLLLKAGHAPSDPAERALHRWLMGPVERPLGRGGPQQLAAGPRSGDRQSAPAPAGGGRRAGAGARRMAAAGDAAAQTPAILRRQRLG